MNRIHNLLDDDLDSILMPAGLTGELEGRTGGEFERAHCVFTPLHYERNYAYPLIVWLHGPDDDECQIKRVMPLVSTRNYVAVGPRGTQSCASEAGGYRWLQEPRHIAEAEDRVHAAIGDARRWLNVAPARIYLAGYGCGGTMALRIALGQPESFAGVLSLCGEFPNTLRPLGQLHVARKLRILLATGRDSAQYPPAEVCKHLRLFHAAGMSVDLRQYPSGDELRTNILSDMDRWIMGHLTQQQPAEHDQPSHRSTGK